jgi:hypothetical protein
MRSTVEFWPAGSIGTLPLLRSTFANETDRGMLEKHPGVGDLPSEDDWVNASQSGNSSPTNPPGVEEGEKGVASGLRAREGVCCRRRPGHRGGTSSGILGCSGRWCRGTRGGLGVLHFSPWSVGTTSRTLLTTVQTFSAGCDLIMLSIFVCCEKGSPGTAIMPLPCDHKPWVESPRHSLL